VSCRRTRAAGRGREVLGNAGKFKVGSHQNTDLSALPWRCWAGTNRQAWWQRRSCLARCTRERRPWTSETEAGHSGIVTGAPALIILSVSAEGLWTWLKRREPKLAVMAGT